MYFEAKLSDHVFIIDPCWLSDFFLCLKYHSAITLHINLLDNLIL